MTTLFTYLLMLARRPKSASESSLESLVAMGMFADSLATSLVAGGGGDALAAGLQVSHF